jgi:hypothetical protein
MSEQLPGRRVFDPLGFQRTAKPTRDPTADDTRHDDLLAQDWSDKWDGLPPAPPLVPRGETPAVVRERLRAFYSTSRAPIQPRSTAPEVGDVSPLWPYRVPGGPE